MGSGASFDAGLGDGSAERYFCHSCHRVFGLGGVQNPQDYYCPHCQSTFLEELGSGAGPGGGDIFAVRHRHNGQLSIDQTRRITNATAMLRLLESQLREELEQLQHAFEHANIRMNSSSVGDKKKLTKVMTGRCRVKRLNLDMVCSQPGCPICSDDFELGADAYRLPCSHLFHKRCVMPWLDLKQNCPICRAELSDELPSVNELQDFTAEELKERLKEVDVDILDADPVANNSEELATLLLQHWQQHKREEAERAVVLAGSRGDGRASYMGPFLRRGYFPDAAATAADDNDNNAAATSPSDSDSDDNASNTDGIDDSRLTRRWERAMRRERAETDRFIGGLERSAESSHRQNFGFVISRRPNASSSNNNGITTINSSSSSSGLVGRPLMFNMSSTTSSQMRPMSFSFGPQSHHHQSTTTSTGAATINGLHSASLDSRRTEEADNDARFPIWLRNAISQNESSTSLSNRSGSNNFSSAATAVNSVDAAATLGVPVSSDSSGGRVGYTFQVRASGNGTYSTVPMMAAATGSDSRDISNGSRGNSESRASILSTGTNASDSIAHSNTSAIDGVSSSGDV